MEKEGNNTEFDFDQFFTVIMGYVIRFFGKERVNEFLSGKLDIEKLKEVPSSMERLKLYQEVLKMASTEVWRSLTTIATLSASLLIIASFDKNLSEIDICLKILISILLILIPMGLWSFYKNFTDALKNAFNEMKEIVEKLDKEKAEKMKEVKKKSDKSFFTKIPAIMNFFLTIVIVGILFLMWK